MVERGYKADVKKEENKGKSGCFHREGIRTFLYVAGREDCRWVWMKCSRSGYQNIWMVYIGKKGFQNICSPDFQAGGIDTWMAADELMAG